MCGPKYEQPKVTYPTKTETVSNEDTAATLLEQQKKRRGFQSTIATSGQGVTSQANTLKTALGA